MPELFDPISNREMFTKPFGGFWASPVDAVYGWKEWCSENDFGDLSRSFTFSITSTANIRHIGRTSDMDDMPKLETVSFVPWVCLDFEKILADGIDGLEVHMSKDQPEDIMQGLYFTLYGWDCDSILIMNPDIVVT